MGKKYEINNRKKKNKKKSQQMMEKKSDQKPLQSEVFEGMMDEIGEKQEQLQQAENEERSWEDLNTANLLKGEKVIVIGLKNSGKSYLCEYLKEEAEKIGHDICILDCDIGRNRGIPGCVSLSSQSKGSNFIRNIWVGEFSPLNEVPNFLKALRYLLSIYEEHYFTHTLILNTMGYLTAMGELLFYELFQLVKPEKVFVMSTPNSIQQPIDTIQYNINSGKYLERLYFSQGENNNKTSTIFQTYVNKKAKSKGAHKVKFQPILTSYPLNSIDQLIILMEEGKLKKIKKNISIWQMEEGKNKKVQQESTQMRVVLLGAQSNENIIEIFGVGFGWKKNIFYDDRHLDANKVQIGLIGENIEFGKSFYQINERTMILMEEIAEGSIPYILPQVKAFGNKGIRNNASLIKKK